MKRIPQLLLLAVLLTSVMISYSQQAIPVNAKATTEAKALLQFLYDIKGKYTLTGQHNYVGSGSAFTDTLEQITGKSPIVWGSDFSFAYEGTEPQKFQHCGPLNLTTPGNPVGFINLTPQQARAALVKNAIAKHQKGHVITLMWHACPPTLGGDSCNGDNIWTWTTDKRPTDAQWNEIVTEGTALNNTWKKQADNIAGYLKQLKEAHIPVLWRPYHEMNGVWFWWCNRKGEDGFKKLWIMMYNYFTNVHHLDNLIWGWNTNAPRDRPGDEAFDYADFYPGSQYVDVLTADVYRKDWKQSHHDQLLKLAAGKPIALGEVGNVPTPQTLLEQPSWCWFMPWGNITIRANTPSELKALYDAPAVLTLDEVSMDKNGKYIVKPK